MMKKYDVVYYDNEGNRIEERLEYKAKDMAADEIAQMNEIKVMADLVGALVQRIFNSRATPEGKRWAATAKTDLQKGFMALTRSVVLPETF